MNGVRSRIRVGGGNGDGNRVGGGNENVNVDGQGYEAGTKTEERLTKARKMGTRTEDEGQDRGEWRRVEYARGNPDDFRAYGGKRGRLGLREKNSKHESIGSVPVNHDNRENSKEAGSETQGTQGLSKNCRCRESVSSLSRLIKSFRNKYS